MTDQPPAATALGAPPEGDPPGDTTDPADSAETSTDASPDEDGKLRKEAARYRLALRAAEGERDALSTRVAAMQRAEIERLVTSTGPGGIALQRADDLWLAGTELDNLLDDAGMVDPGKVRATVAALIEERPHWKFQPRVTSFDGGTRSNPESLPTSWSDALGSASR